MSSIEEDEGRDDRAFTEERMQPTGRTTAGLARMARQAERQKGFEESRTRRAREIEAKVGDAGPTLQQLREWYAGFRVAYRTQHQARNRQILANTTDQSSLSMTNLDEFEERVFTGNAREVMQHVEAEVAHVESIVRIDTEGYSIALDRGYDAGRSGGALDCPFTERESMKWWAWWQGVYQSAGAV